MDRLLALHETSTELAAAHQKAVAFVSEEYHLAAQQKDWPVAKHCLNSIAINSFFNLLDSSNMEVKNIVEEMKRSWKIYELNSIDRLRSFEERGALMKEHFLSYFHSVSQNKESPKILIKLGAMHTMRGKTPLQIEDIGEVIATLAEEQAVKDINLFFMFRYYIDTEEELGYFDNAEGNSKWLQDRRPFMLQGKVNQWTLLDLKALHDFTKEEEIYVNPVLQSFIDRHDYIILPPATQDIQKNYTDQTISNL